MKVAIVHDWLTGMRGGENPRLVIPEFAEGKYPGSLMYTQTAFRGIK